LGTIPLAIPDMLISGAYNAPNNAALSGQKFAQAGMMQGDERNSAYMEGTSLALTAFLGFGDVATVGWAGSLSRAAIAQSKLSSFDSTIFPGLGQVSGSYSAISPGPLAENIAGTFAGGKYQVVVLQHDTV